MSIVTPSITLLIPTHEPPSIVELSIRSPGDFTIGFEDTLYSVNKEPGSIQAPVW